MAGSVPNSPISLLACSAFPAQRPCAVLVHELINLYLAVILLRYPASAHALESFPPFPRADGGLSHAACGRRARRTLR